MLRTKIPLWTLSLIRRKLCERVGVRTYSRPSYENMAVKLASILPHPGFFVEAGAVDGFFESNTYELERFHGWRGILIEPLPEMIRRIEWNRSRSMVFHCALVSHGWSADVAHLKPRHAMSKISLAGSGTIVVPARTLDSVLVEAGVHAIDLLSLDVEGFEPTVLRGLTLDVHNPRFILIECLTQDARKEIDSILLPQYVLLAQLSHRDFLYERRTNSPCPQ